MTFTAMQGEVVATPQTRVSESPDGASSQWTEDDQIKVQIGKGMAGTYALNVDGTIKNTIESAYWQSNEKNQDITAWYSASSNPNLKDQSSV